MKLDAQQLADYQRNGYLFLPGVFNTAEVDALRSEVPRIFAMRRPEVWREAKSDAVRAAFAAHLYSDAFGKLARHPRVIGPARQLLDDDIYMHQFKINGKEAFRGEGFIWHQDFGSWRRDDGMPEPRAVNVAVFIDDVTEFNGPLWVIPRSHTLGVIDASYDTTASSFALWQPDVGVIKRLADANGIFSAKGPAGSVLLFHCQILHASPANLSPWPRNIVYFTANAVSNAARSFKRPEFVAMRDFAAIVPDADDCLAQ